MDRNRMERLFNAACDDVFGEEDSFFGGLERLGNQTTYRRKYTFPMYTGKETCTPHVVIPHLMDTFSDFFVCGKCWHTISGKEHYNKKRRRRR